MSTSVNILLGDQNSAWFTANSAIIPLKGQHIYLNDGVGIYLSAYKVGDGVLNLSTLSWKGLDNVGSYIPLPGTTTPITGLLEFDNTVNDLIVVNNGTSNSKLSSDGTFIGLNATSGIGIGGSFTADSLGSATISAGIGLGGIQSFILSPSTDNIVINSNSNTFKGLQYTANYSANFTARSLIDKGYSDSTYLALAGGTLTGNLNGQGLINLGNAAGTNQRQVRIGQGTSYMDIGELVGTGGIPAIYFSQATPSATNYAIIGTSNNTIINAPSASGVVSLYFAGTSRYQFSSNNIILSPSNSSTGFVTGLTYNGYANTAQTSGEIEGMLIKLGSRQWVAGNIPLQREISIIAPTYSFTAASVIDKAFSLYVGLPIASTFATITNNFAAGFVGGILVDYTVGGARVQLGSLASNQNALINYSAVSDNSLNISSNYAGGSTNNITLSVAGTTLATFSQKFTSFTNQVSTSGIVTPFSFLAPNNTGQTGTANIPKFLFTSGNTQWASGAITLQENFRITAPVYSHVSGSNTITTAGTLNVYAATTSGGFTTITNNYAIISNGGILVTGTSLISGAATFSNTINTILTNNNLQINTLGKGLQIKGGTNSRIGTSTLVAGTLTVANTSITANTRIQLTIQSLGTVTVPTAIGVTAKVVGTSFTITSANAVDTSVITWVLFEEI